MTDQRSFCPRCGEAMSDAAASDPLGKSDVGDCDDCYFDQFELVDEPRREGDVPEYRRDIPAVVRNDRGRPAEQERGGKAAADERVPDDPGSQFTIDRF